MPGAPRSGACTADRHLRPMVADLAACLAVAMWRYRGATRARPCTITEPRNNDKNTRPVVRPPVGTTAPGIRHLWDADRCRADGVAATRRAIRCPLPVSGLGMRFSPGRY